MKQKQMRDERLSALLTEAYDAHLDAAEVRDPAKAFPSGGRWREAPDEGPSDVQSDKTNAAKAAVSAVSSAGSSSASSRRDEPCASADKQGLSLQAQRQAGGEPEAPVAIRSTSTKRARWQGAVAAILVMTVLGAGGWLLHRQLTRKTPEAAFAAVDIEDPSTPQNCHPADLGGETVWVLEDENARYEGEYDLQSLTEKNPEINWSRDEEREGFEQQTLMSYAEYAAYCEKWGMDQKYRDPDQRYLVWAKWYPNNFGEDLRLIDVTWDAQTAYLYFWNQDEPQVKLTTYWANPGRAWVLVLPTTLEITSLETRRVMSEKTYHWKHLDLTLWEKNKMETLPDGSVRIIGWAERAEPFGHVPPKAFILRFGDETICIWTENTPMWDPEGEPFEDFFDISKEPTGGGLPYRYLFVRAEGCQRIEDRGLNGEPDEYPDYRADWLFLSCNVDPEAAFAAVDIEDPSTPQNCHPADLGGETVYVLDDEDAEYEGEYDLQEADLWEGPGLTTNPVSPEEEAPEGFSQKTVMTYEAYAAYCEKWGLEQKYKDPNRRYLVCAAAEFSFGKRQPCLTDVQYFGQTAYLFLYYKTLYHSIDYRSAWVLTVPTDAEVSNLELPRLLTRADYESKTAELARRAKNRMETLPDGSIRIIGYAHVTAVRVGEQNGGVPVEFEVQIDGKTVCVWVEDTELLNPDGTPFTDDSAWSARNDAAPGAGEALPCVCIRAEGCERIEDRGIFGDLPDDYPDYRAARLIVACDPDPEAAFAAVNVNGSGEQETNAVFTETENGNYLSPWGEEYALLANEGILDCIGTETFVGKVSGEGEGPAWKAAYGFYALDEDEARNILIRVSSSEWYGIYRKVSSPPFDFSVDNCVRLELVKNSWLLKNNTEHLTCGDGITDPVEIAAFLAEVRSQKSPEEAGLYDLVRKENGFLENCYQYGVIYGFFSEEPNLAVPLTVTSYNDMAYSVSIEQKEYVLPEKWVKRLRGKS